MDFPVVSGSIVLLRSCDWLGTFKNQGSSGYCNGGDWQGALWKQKNWARDYARGTGKRGYCIYKPSMQPALSSPSPHPASPPEGLRRRVERCPQRVLNTAVHFTACKAIISIPTSLAYPPSPLPSAPETAESAHLHMESGSLNRDVIDLPLFVRGKCSQTSQANFAVLQSQQGLWVLDWERKITSTSLPHSHELAGGHTHV